MAYIKPRNALVRLFYAEISLESMMLRILIVVMLSLTITQLSLAQSEEETIIQQFNSAAESWYSQLEFDVEFAYRHSLISNRKFEELVKADGSEFLAEGPSATGFACKSPFFFRERFQILGKPQLVSESGVSTWNSTEWGFFNSVQYRVEINDHSDEIPKPGRKVYLSLKDGSTELPNPFSPYHFCGGTKRAINVPKVEDRKIVTRQSANDEIKIDVDFSVDDQTKIEHSYIFRTDLDCPLLKCFESKTFIKGVCTLQSHSSIRKFDEIQGGPFPSEFVTVLGPLKSPDKPEPVFLLRVWKATKLQNKVAEQRYSLAEFKDLPWRGLRPDLEAKKSVDMKKWDAETLWERPPPEIPSNKNSAAGPSDEQSVIKFEILKFLAGAGLFLIGVVLMRRAWSLV